FSGDKLLGGPQAGAIVGAAATLDKVRRHPLMRALRPDKMTLAALEATLELYRDDRAAEVPALAMLRLSPGELEARARRLAELAAGARIAIEVVPVASAVGGGALPLVEPPSFALALSSPDRSAEALDAALRAFAPPVIGRIADGRLLLDVRTVAEAELGEVAAAVKSV